ncbi:MAG TPA: FkbM family methyltransferase [Acidiferrobacteraceae bacterium]|nr:FkbM family methyltransferase [Acidiferrobacteraceae bacterium]
MNSNLYTDNASGAFVPFEVFLDESRDAELSKLVAALSEFGKFDFVAANFASITRSFLMRASKTGDSDHGVVRLRSGVSFRVDLSDHFGAFIYYGYLQESHDLNVFCRMIRTGARVVDIGANFGLYSISAARLVGAGGRVYAFEPVPESFELLQQNIKSNNLEDVVSVSDSCIAADIEKADFNLTVEPSFSGLHDTSRSVVREVISVECIPLDHHALLQDGPIDQIKIDVEGAELDVLTGAAGIIKRSPDIVIQFEVTSKNLEGDRLGKLIDWLLEKLEDGFILRTGLDGGYSEKGISNADQILDAMGGNLFLTRKGSGGERRLIDALSAERTEDDLSHQDSVNDRELLHILIGRLYRELHITELLESERNRMLAVERKDKKEYERILRRLAKLLPPDNRPIAENFNSYAQKLVDSFNEYLASLKRLGNERKPIFTVERKHKKEYERILRRLAKLLPPDDRPIAANFDSYGQKLVDSFGEYLATLEQSRLEKNSN